MRKVVWLGGLGLWAGVGLAQPAAPVRSTSILIDGSSTVAPLTEAVAADFSARRPEARIAVGVSGTSGGFRRFFPGEIDINNASRPIRTAEIQKAVETRIEYHELMVGLDGIVVAVSRGTKIFRGKVPVMTLGELALLWGRESEGLVTRWNHLGSRFVDAPIVLSGGSSASGTFDLFTSVVCGKEGDSRADYFGTEEDQLLAEQTGADPYSLTYFGFPFLEHNKHLVQAVSIDPRMVVIDPPAEILNEVNRRRAVAGKPPLTPVAKLSKGILPTPETIGEFRYPLSRPLFIYVNAKSAKRPLVEAFVAYYLSEEVIGSEEFMLNVGFLPPSAELRKAAREIWAKRRTGTAFGGGISGRTLEELAELYKAHAGL